MSDAADRVETILEARGAGYRIRRSRKRRGTYLIETQGGSPVIAGLSFRAKQHYLRICPKLENRT